MANHRKYNWAEWFKRRKFSLVRGTDFVVSNSSFVQQLRNAAGRAGYTAQVTDLGDILAVELVKRRRKCRA